MAKIQYSALVSDMRGKHNGSVHSANSSGAYVRIKGTKVNPDTIAQRAVRQKFGTNAQAWRGLSESQRSAWNQTAKSVTITNIFGKLVPPTGFNYFMQLNGNIAAIGGTAIASPPAPASVFGFSALSPAMKQVPQSVILTFSSAIPPGTSVAVYATEPMSPGKSFVKSEYRQITVLTSTDNSPKTISAAYIAKFGNFANIGQKVFFKLVPVITATGQSGQAISASTLIIA